MTRPLVLVLACGALLISTEAQVDYHSLPELYKTAIKHAVKNAHQRTSQHMNFYAMWGDPKISDDYIEVEFHLRATKCSKSAAPNHRGDCVFMTNRPFINCRVCSKRSGSDLIDPSIDCTPQRRVHEATVQDKRQNMCRGITSVHSPMAITDAEKAEIDCLGCF